MDTLAVSDPMTAPASVTPVGSAAATVWAGNRMMSVAWKEFGEVLAGTVNSHFDQTVSACHAMARAGSMKDAFDIQADYMRGSARNAVAAASGFILVSSRLARNTMTSTAAPSAGPRAADTSNTQYG